MKKGKHGSSKSGLKAVLDTNVYLSAFRSPSGTPAKLFESAILGRYELIVSPALIREFARIARERFQVPESVLQGHIRLIVHHATVVTPYHVPSVVSVDPDDDYVIACAVVGAATVIVSGDKDLLRLKTWEGISIMRPIDFLRTLGPK